MNEASARPLWLQVTNASGEARPSQQLIELLEAERAKIAREIHDEAGQLLISAAFRLDHALTMLPKGFVARELVEQARQTLDDCADALHRIAFDLRPRILDDLGLIPALRSYLKQYAKLGDVELETVLGEPQEKTSPAVELAVFRIVQEAIANIRKHAHATCVRVHLTFGPGHVQLEVSDDGIGFDSGEVDQEQGLRPRMGLAGLRERAAGLGGELEVESRHGAGTTVRARLPVDGRDAL